MLTHHLFVLHASVAISFSIRPAYLHVLLYISAINFQGYAKSVHLLVETAQLQLVVSVAYLATTFLILSVYHLVHLRIMLIMRLANVFHAI